jgi:D-glycero-alpha-D-manno-heptose 1-phosphate guanylyltransferase
MRAIILAGGFGTRLQSVVADVPKPMAPIDGKPFLAYLLCYLACQGITEIVLSVHHLHEKISDYFQQQYAGIKIQYAIEDTPLGTGGAIYYALQKIMSNEPVFVLNGDTFVTVDYKQMYEQHSHTMATLTMALREIPDCSRYGHVSVTDNMITGFQDKGTSGTGYINAGVYLLQKNVFEHTNLSAAFSFESDFILKQFQQIRPQAFFAKDYFIDIGIPSDYQRAIKELPELINL